MNEHLKSLLTPTATLDFELIDVKGLNGMNPIHSYRIRTTLESGERVIITECVASAFGGKLNKSWCWNESGMNHDKPDTIAGRLAATLYGQDRNQHTFNIRLEDRVSEAEKHKHEQIEDMREAVSCSRPEFVQTLLEKGANASTENRYGQTLLHWVGRQQDCSDKYASSGETARVLLHAGANVNAKDKSGETPLHAAMDLPVAQALLEAGADTQIKNNRGKTALEVQRYRLGDVAELIETFEKRQQARNDLSAIAQAARPQHSGLLDSPLVPAELQRSIELAQFFKHPVQMRAERGAKAASADREVDQMQATQENPHHDNDRYETRRM